jgi:hypothetical protein
MAIITFAPGERNCQVKKVIVKKLLIPFFATISMIAFDALVLAGMLHKVSKTIP